MLIVALLKGISQWHDLMNWNLQIWAKNSNSHRGNLTRRERSQNDCSTHTHTLYQHGTKYDISHEVHYETSLPSTVYTNIHQSWFLSIQVRQFHQPKNGLSSSGRMSLRLHPVNSSRHSMGSERSERLNKSYTSCEHSEWVWLHAPDRTTWWPLQGI